MSEGVATSEPIDWPSKYLAVGQLLGAIVGFLSFVAAWIYCIAKYGFLVGVCLGWIAGGICGAVAAAIVCYLWGPIALGGVLLALYLSGPKAVPATASTPDATTATSDIGWAVVSEAPSVPEPSLSSPAAPKEEDVESAIADFWRVYQKTGMAGAVLYSVDCYAGLQTSREWAIWDRCATVDYYAQRVDDAFVRQANAPPTEYFRETAVSSRRSKAAMSLRSDWQANGDRALALAALIDASNSKAADARASQPESTEMEGPSFDCAKVRSAVLTLVCRTPSLAEADRNLAAAYKAARERSSAPDTLQESQLEWIRRRNSGDADKARLEALYVERTAQLTALNVEQ